MLDAALEKCLEANPGRPLGTSPRSKIHESKKSPEPRAPLHRLSALQPLASFNDKGFEGIVLTCGRRTSRDLHGGRVHRGQEPRAGNAETDIPAMQDWARGSVGVEFEVKLSATSKNNTREKGKMQASMVSITPSFPKLSAGG